MNTLRIWIAISLFFSGFSHADGVLERLSVYSHSGLLLQNSSGQKVIAVRENDRLIPASTTKLLTAWMALNHWGENHRFQTDFYFDQEQAILWIKGSGDPYLVSEEIAVIAKQLRQSGLQHINAIAIDDTLFAKGLLLPGTGHSDNPYDAVPSALAANFNTVSIKKRNGKIVSGEQQTPLTKFAKQVAVRIKSRQARVNTGTNPRDAERYFAQILAEFLKKQGVTVSNKLIFGQLPLIKLIYSHKNSKPLNEIVRAMLRYSTNFVANQLALMLCAEEKQPVQANDVHLLMEKTMREQFHWRAFHLYDGAGLSRDNRLSAQQLVDVLKALEPWRDLLPRVENNIYAKTGTLSDVSSLAGYIVGADNWQPFALLINQKTPYKLRNEIALTLQALVK